MTQLHPDFLRLPIAHRALHDLDNGRPENSPAAIRAAIDHGYAIEIDLQLSSDGQAMVFHDYDLGRLTGRKGAIRQHSAAELSQIPLIGGSETIPTLQQVLSLVDGQVPLLVEIKDQDGIMGANVGHLEQAAAKQLRDYAGPLAVMSFNPNSVQQMVGLLPDVARGIVTSTFDAEHWPLLPKGTRERLRTIPDYDTVRASFVSHEAHDLDNPRIHDLKRRGASVLCWTIRSPEFEAEARKVAENITFEGYMAATPA